LKEEFLIEVTHVPLRRAGYDPGMGRWLRASLAAQAGRFPGRICHWAFTLVGVVLVLIGKAELSYLRHRPPRARLALLAALVVQNDPRRVLGSIVDLSWDWRSSFAFRSRS